MLGPIRTFLTTVTSETNPSLQSHSGWRVLGPRCVALLLLAGAVAICGLHPYWGGWLLVLSLALFAGSAYWPIHFFVTFPILLVAADGYLLTGQMVVKEYDPLLLASFAGSLWNGLRVGQRKVSRPLLWFGSIFLISFLVSGYRGVTVLPGTDFRDQLSVYFSSWNVLRIGKGYFWGTAFLVMLLGSTLKRDKALRGLVLGLQFAALYVGLFVLAERLIFEGLWDFSRVLRASGPFATMHIGDQHLDGFLALALPMVWYGTLHGGFTRWRQSRESLRAGSASYYGDRPGDLRDDRFRWTRLIWPGVLSALIMHAGVSSMSRATIVVLLTQLLLLAVAGAAVLATARARDWLKRTLLIVGFGMGLMIAGASLAMRSEAISARFETSQSDMLVRWKHWRMCVALTQDRTANLVFGRGVGTLPTVLAEASDRPTPPLRWLTGADGNSGRVIMQPGWPIYLEHWLLMPDRGSAELRFSTKSLTASTEDQVHVTISRCTKALLQSYDCDAEKHLISPLASEQALVTLDAPQADTRGGVPAWRPQTLAFHVDGDSPVELQDVHIKYRNLSHRSLAPDDFSGGIAGWTFTCDDHLIWRAKNIWVHLLLEQGWLGMLAAIGFQLGLVSQLIRGNGLCGIDRAAVATALLGFAAVGFFGTLIDTPWLTAIALSVVAALSISASSDH
ncbi:hypothetical protein SH139x_000176 [Planctomycetaceae bacterium SH139]